MEDKVKVVGRRSFIKRVSIGVVGVLGALVAEPEVTRANANSPSGNCNLYLQNDPSKCVWASGYPRRYWDNNGYRCVEVYVPGATPTSCYDQLSKICCSYEYKL